MAGIAGASSVWATSALAKHNHPRTVTEYSGRLQASNFQRFAEQATHHAGRSRFVKLDVVLDPKETGLVIQRSSNETTIQLENDQTWKLVIEGNHPITDGGDIRFDRFFLKWALHGQSGTPVRVLADAKNFKYDHRTMRLRRVGI
jgi:hypothetical protein